MIRILLLPLVSLFVLLPGCASVRVNGSDEFVMDKDATYGWSTPQIHDGQSELPWTAFQSALEAQFETLGITRVEDGEPDWLLMVDFAIVRKIQNNDPVFALWVAEKYEEGSLRLDVLSPVGQERVWRGETRVRLRTVSRTMGGARQRWAETGDERDWQLEEAARRICEALPVR